MSRDDYIKEHGGDDITFNLVDKNTVKRLQKKGDVELPYKDLDEEKDEKWNTKLLNSKLMENVLSGTMLTGAENAGRQDSYEDLTEQGVVMKKVWIATPDDHTRESHFDLDGEEVDVDEEFSNGCMYPGDPNGDPPEVYNCRCSMRTHIVGFKKNDGSVVEVKGDRGSTMHEEQMEAEEERREVEKEKKEEKITVVEAPVPDTEGPMKGVAKTSDTSVESIIKETNPHWEEGREYSENCANCVVASDIRARGYNVEAKERDFSRTSNIYRFRYDGKTGWGSWTDSYEGGIKPDRIIVKRKTQVVEAVSDKMKEYGDNSRAVVFVQWDGKNVGHYFNVSNENGHVIFFDSQNGTMGKDVEEYFMRARPSATCLFRTDDKELTDFAMKVVKEK